MRSARHRPPLAVATRDAATPLVACHASTPCMPCGMPRAPLHAARHVWYGWRATLYAVCRAARCTLRATRAAACLLSCIGIGRTQSCRRMRRQRSLPRASWCPGALAPRSTLSAAQCHVKPTHAIASTPQYPPGKPLRRRVRAGWSAVLLLIAFRTPRCLVCVACCMPYAARCMHVNVACRVCALNLPRSRVFLVVPLRVRCARLHWGCFAGGERSKPSRV